MKPFYVLIFTAAFLPLMTGCAQSEKAVISEKSVPYHNLGTLEVYSPLGDDDLYEDVRESLTDELALKAKELHGADAITDLRFWPEPGSRAAEEGVYGRADMIRYRRYAAQTTAR